MQWNNFDQTIVVTYHPCEPIAVPLLHLLHALFQPELSSILIIHLIGPSVGVPRTQPCASTTEPNQVRFVWCLHVVPAIGFLLATPGSSLGDFSSGYWFGSGQGDDKVPHT